MAGLIDTGTGYQGRALQGFVRQSSEQEQIDQENERLKAQGKMQKTAVTASLVGTGAAVGGSAGAAMIGAEAGSAIGPGYGTLIGAGVGFLLSRLF
jgi:hypothetical protein